LVDQSKSVEISAAVARTVTTLGTAIRKKNRL
jgi:hypothetical protein